MTDDTKSYLVIILSLGIAMLIGLILGMNVCGYLEGDRICFPLGE